MNPTTSLKPVNYARRPIVFLDIDDVLCQCNEKYSGFKVMDAMEKIIRGTPQHTYEDLWENVFSIEARACLKILDTLFQPIYVISSSWRLYMGKTEMQNLFLWTGIEFVSNNLHKDWATPTNYTNGEEVVSRAGQIALWLNCHPEYRDCWAALDDEFSGTGFDIWPVQAQRNQVALCKACIGLTSTEFFQISDALHNSLVYL